MLNDSNRWRGGTRPKKRITLDTNDIAELLNTTPQAIRLRITRGSLVFTGDAVADTRMLFNLMPPNGG